MAGPTLLGPVTAISNPPYNWETLHVNGSGETVLLTATFDGTFTPIMGPTGGVVVGMTGSINSAEITIMPAPDAILPGMIGMSVVGWLQRRKSL